LLVIHIHPHLCRAAFAVPARIDMRREPFPRTHPQLDDAQVVGIRRIKDVERLFGPLGEVRR